MIEARSDLPEVVARIRPFVAKRVPTSDIDDVVQEVFLRMQRGLKTLREEDRFGPWVYQVARSAIVDHHRARAKHPIAEEECDRADSGADDGDANADTEALLAEYVAPFVAMLPSPYREALTLTELEGVSQREAAAMLGISVSGMKSRVQRGREKLRALFDACCNIALDARGRVIDCVPREQGRPR